MGEASQHARPSGGGLHETESCGEQDAPKAGEGSGQAVARGFRAPGERRGSGKSPRIIAWCSRADSVTASVSRSDKASFADLSRARCGAPSCSPEFAGKTSGWHGFERRAWLMRRGVFPAVFLSRCGTRSAPMGPETFASLRDTNRRETSLPIPPFAMTDDSWRVRGRRHRSTARRHWPHSWHEGWLQPIVERPS